MSVLHELLEPSPQAGYPEPMGAGRPAARVAMPALAGVGTSGRSGPRGIVSMVGAIALFWLLQAIACPAVGVAGHAKARLVAERTATAPGETAELLLVLDISPGWHTYWLNPGDSGEPPRIDWTLPEGVTAGPLRFLTPSLIRVGPFASYGYSAQALHPVALRIPTDWPADEPIEVRAHARWLVCEEECIPEEALLDLSLATADRPGPADPAAASLFAAARAGLPRGDATGAVLAAAPDGARLSVPLGALPERPAGVRFFPSAWGLLEHAADQPWRIAGDRLEIDLTAGPAFADTDPGGLLVIQDGRGETGSYRVAPDRGRLPAVDTDSADLGIPLALGLALLGGLLLNLMPCVFPVLAIKVLALAGQGELGPAERGAHGLAYTLGVLLFFALLGALLLALRAGGAAVGWGFQLQYSPFVAAMAYLFLVLGLALAGTSTLGTGLMGVAGALPIPGRSGRGLAAAFGTGALAALVAAPCTAPFMGAALGYGLTLPWPAALAILLALGLGLAAPFLLLSFWPGLARRLPRSGPWMETLKQLLAFPMLGASAWLLWVHSVQTGPAGLALVLSGMLALTFGLWVRERIARGPWRRAGSLAAAAGLGAALWLGWLTGGTGAGVRPQAHPAAGGPPGEPYSAERLGEARALSRPVFVNMTAAWCITCLVNERVALHSETVVRAFAERNVLYLEGDWTDRDPAIADYLSAFGRTGVPIYVLYPPGGEPRVLPQILTPTLVRQALESAGVPVVQSQLRN